jgi:hypothetical protein
MWVFGGSACAGDLTDACSRTLPSRAGAGSYGPLSQAFLCPGMQRHRGHRALRYKPKHAPVAQLDRALDYESRGQEFESLRARHLHVDFESESLRGFPALDFDIGSGRTGAARG